MASADDILGELRRLEDNLVDRLAAEMERRFVEFRLEVSGRFDALEARLGRLETEYQMIVVALQRIEETLAEDRSERVRLRAEISDLRKRLAELDRRTRELEARLEED